MKITIYELLGLVKDGKAPTKIKYKNNIFYFDKHCYIYENKIDTGIAMWDFSCLNDEVEIIEEDKKIEKLNTSIINANRYDYDKNKEMTISNITADILSISKAINELIDEINNLKEK